MDSPQRHGEHREERIEEKWPSAASQQQIYKSKASPGAETFDLAVPSRQVKNCVFHCDLCVSVVKEI